MTNHPYPAMPDPHYFAGDHLPFGEVKTDCFTAAQMRAYVDADREQRKPLTDDECEAVVKALYEFGIKHRMSAIDDVANLHEQLSELRSLRCDAIRAALNPPPRSDAGNN